MLSLNTMLRGDVSTISNFNGDFPIIALIEKDLPEPMPLYTGIVQTTNARIWKRNESFYYLVTPRLFFHDRRPAGVNFTMSRTMYSSLRMADQVRSQANIVLFNGAGEEVVRTPLAVPPALFLYMDSMGMGLNRIEVNVPFQFLNAFANAATIEEAIRFMVPGKEKLTASFTAVNLPIGSLFIEEEGIEGLGFFSGQTIPIHNNLRFLIEEYLHITHRRRASFFSAIEPLAMNIAQNPEAAVLEQVPECWREANKELLKLYVNIGN